MIKPRPYKLVCNKCGHSKIVRPKSDALSPQDLVNMIQMCPKCDSLDMTKKELELPGIIDIIASIFKK